MKNITTLIQLLFISGCILLSLNNAHAIIGESIKLTPSSGNFLFSPILDDPEAQDDIVVTLQDTPIIIVVLNNDTGDGLTVSIVTNPANGTIEVNSNGTILYTPNAGYTGTDSFIYLVTDIDGLTAQATVDITINAVTSQVLAVNDTVSTLQNSGIIVNVLANDIGTDISVLDIGVDPTDGTVIINTDGTISYIPNPGFSGIDLFTYTITDATGTISAASVIVEVISTGNEVIAIDDATTTLINTPINIIVLLNDIGTNLGIFGIPIEPTNGTATINIDNSITYTPNLGFVGTDEFTYLVEDEFGNGALAVVSILVSDITSTDNLPPNIDTFTICTEPLTPTQICHPYTDPNGDGISYDEEETHTTFNCSITYLNDTCIRYTALPGFFGTDTIFAVICDDQVPSLCATSVIIVHVGCIYFPEAQNDEVTIAEDAYILNGETIPAEAPHNGIVIPLAENDYDACAFDLGVNTIVSGPFNGSAEIVDGQVLYDPGVGFTGTDQLQYVTCNDCPLCDTATVTINVEPGPVCNYDLQLCLPSFTAFEICPDFCDINTDNIVDINVTTTVGSVVDGSAAECFIFIPPGDEPSALGVITFTACDTNGECSSTIADVAVDEGCGENPPIGVNDTVSVLLGENLLIDVLGNDIEIDGHAMIVNQVFDPPNCGTVSITANQISYTPTSVCGGTDTIVYVVCDIAEMCDTATVFITIGTNCTFQTEYCTDPLTPVEICVEFCDLLGTAPEIINATTVFNSGINLLTNNCIQYTPLPDHFGLDTVTIVGSNALGETENVEVYVQIACAQPVAENDDVLTNVNTSLLIDALINDTDPCSDELNTLIVSPPVNGTAFVNDEGLIVYTPNPGFTGTDVIFYNACNQCANPDTGPICDDASIQVTVLPGPTSVIIAEPDMAQTPFQTPVSVNVLINDEGEALYINNIANPANGTAVLDTATNTIVYTPNAGFAGFDYFLYEVCNVTANCTQTLVSIEVLAEDAPNHPPNTNNEIFITGEDSPITVPVLYNDSDPEGGAINLGNILVPPTDGTAVINTNGTVTYTPNLGFIGNDSFVYEACDTEFNCTAGVVVIVVGEGIFNDAPEAINDEVSTPIGVAITIAPLANDDDPQNYDGNPDNNQILILNTITDPLYGTLVFEEGDTYTYTPQAGYQGFDYFAYIVCDNGVPSLCDTAYVVISVGETNQPPTAEDDIGATTVSMPTNIDVLANDNDPDNNNEELIITILNPPANGTVTPNGVGVFTYFPNLDYIGEDSFTYQVCDPSGACAEAVVNITIGAPIEAAPDVVYTTEGEAITIAVLENDIGTGIILDGVTIIPVNGIIESASPETGELVYLPNVDFVGTDHFTYIMCDEAGNCDSTIVAIIIIPVDAENEAPNGNNDYATIAIDETATINVLHNDSDSHDDNEALSVTDILDQPTNGTVELNADGTITYTPNEGYEGCDEFSYEVCDSEGFCDTGNVSVLVGGGNCLNIPPIAQNDEASTANGAAVVISVLENDIDLDGEIVSLFISSNPSVCQAEVVGETILYTPCNNYVGLDYFTYVICDSGTPTFCDTAYVTVDVLPENINAEPDIAYTLENTPIDINALDNDSGTSLEITAIVTNPEHGSITDSGSDYITYTPNEGFTGTDYFEYQVCDDISGECAITLVTILVLGDGTVNVPPIAIIDQYFTPLETPIVIFPVENDFDPLGGDIITLVDYSMPNFGDVILTSDGELIYTPLAGSVETDSFTYTICDNGEPELCDTGTVIITIQDGSNENQTPDAVNDIASTTINQNTQIDILGNDSDPNDDNLNIIWISDPLHGMAVIEGSGNSLTYTPDSSFMGTDYIAYIICDDGSPTLCDTAYVSVNIVQDTLSISEQTEQATPINICLSDYLDIAFEIDTIEVLDVPDNGGLIIINQCVQYIPNSDFIGQEIMLLSICDENDNCESVTIFIMVGTISEPPIANNDTATVNLNTPLSINVLGNDYDPDADEITAIILQEGPFLPDADINLDFTTLTVEYIPPPDVCEETDSFSYVITDATGMASDTAWVVVSLDCTEPNDTTPVEENIIAAPDDAFTDVNSLVQIPVLENDQVLTEEDTETVSIVVVVDPENGSATPNDNLTITYAPDADFADIDSFLYEVCVETVSGAIYCDSAIVTIAVDADLPPECDEPIRFAEGFSPNEDGINDVFLVDNIDCYSSFEPEITILNRWGDVVYHITNFSNEQAWNGNWQNNNTQVPDGTYFYILRYTTPEGEELMNGFLEVRR